jgi:Holliday junction resolvasome RuvABC endonuclease subunit
MTIYIGVDQSLAATGIAVVTKRRTHEGVSIEMALYTECVLTEAIPDKLRKKLDVSKAEDDGERIDKIAREIACVINMARNDRGPGEYIRVACEAPSGSQDARAAKALGMAYAIVRTMFFACGVEFDVIAARDAKKALVGVPDASKDEVAVRATDLYGEAVTHHVVCGKKKKRTKIEREAISDALAITAALMEVHP